MSLVFSTYTENYNCDYNNRSYNFAKKVLNMSVNGCFLSTYRIAEVMFLPCAGVLALYAREFGNMLGSG